MNTVLREVRIKSISYCYLMDSPALWIVDVHLTGTAFNIVSGADTFRI